MPDQDLEQKVIARLAEAADDAASNYSELVTDTIKWFPADDQPGARGYLAQLAVAAPHLFNATVLRQAADDLDFVQQTVRDAFSKEQDD